MTSARLHHLHDREGALAILGHLYEALDIVGITPNTPDVCEHMTPICSETEAEYIRDSIGNGDVSRWLDVRLATRKWFTAQAGVRTQDSFTGLSKAPKQKQAEIERLHHSQCPFLSGDGSCKIEGLQPIDCRVAGRQADLPPLFLASVDRIFGLYPQMTGFLPTQLHALLDQPDFYAQVAQRGVDDAKLAKGSFRPLVTTIDN